MRAEYLGCGPHRRWSDGSEGTVTVEWFNGKDRIASPTVGCVVKNDSTFRELTNNTVTTEETKYYAYARIPPENSNKAEISVHCFTEPGNEKKCTVNDVAKKIKKVHFGNHEYIFVPCEDSSFNRSSFLKKYSISVKIPALIQDNVCKDGKFMGLIQKGDPKRFKFFYLNKLKGQESNNDFDKMEETGPLLRLTRVCPCHFKKRKTLVGYYEKSGNDITPYTFRNTDTDETVPSEILARGQEAFEAYKEALKNGTVKDKRVLVTVVGPARAGKTSLLRTLKGEEFNPKEDSTPGVQLQEAFYKPKENSWSEKNRRRDLSFKICMAKTIAENLCPQTSEIVTEPAAANFQSERVKSDDVSYSQENRDKTSEEEPVVKRAATNAQLKRPERDEESYSQENRDLISDDKILQKPESGREEVPREIVDEIISNLTAKSERKNDNEMSFKTLDFAGQAVYNVIYPLFMSSKAIYILVHNLENDLLSHAKSKGKHENSEREFENHFQMTNLDVLEFWLSCISFYGHLHGHSANKPQVESRLSSAMPPVFVVCTHADLCKQDSKQVAEKLYNSLKRPENPSGEHVIGKTYPVDNTLSGNEEIKDESAKRLKGDIEELSKFLPQMNEDIPLRWLQFEDKLSNLAKKEKKKYIDLDEAARIATECKVNTKSKEFTTLLNYLHDLRTIIYLAGEDTRTMIFIDTQWLVNMFVKVITVMPVNEREGRDDYWRKLEDEGILQRDLVEHVWRDIVDDKNTVNSMLLIMEKFSLICRWKLNEQEVYLVPSMLCNSMSHESFETLLAEQKSSTMAVRFDSVHLPLGIFPRLLVAIAEHGKKEWLRIRLPNLRPNFCRMFSVGEEGMFDIFITSDIRTICVTVYNKNEVDGQKVTQFCQSLRKLLEGIFSDMRHNFPWMENTKYEYGIRCPICIKSLNECIKHNTKGCTRDSCLHFVKEEELKQDRPECYKNELSRDNFIKEETYLHWFPKKRVQASHLEKKRKDNISQGNSTFNLSDEEKRWLVIGISLNKVLLPTLREFVKLKMEEHYIDLKTKHKIDKQSYPEHLVNDGTCELNYRNINNNEATRGWRSSYNYNVTSAVDLAKLYLQPHMAKFTGFDDTCDISAVLGILSSASVFSPGVQNSARIVRQDVRNEWGHCNIARWDDATFKICFQKMDNLLKALSLSPEEEDKITKELGDWENKGPVDPELIKLFSGQVSQLSQGAKHLEAIQKEEADQVNNSLQSVQPAIDDFKKEVNKKMENTERVVKGIDERDRTLESERLTRSDGRVTQITCNVSTSGNGQVLVEPNSKFPVHSFGKHNSIVSEVDQTRQIKELDNFINKWGKKRIKITADGHCILHSFLEGLREANCEPVKSVELLFPLIKTEILDNLSIYSPFIGEIDFIKELDDYFDSRRYNASIVDLMPYVLANVTNTFIFLFYVDGEDVRTLHIPPRRKMYKCIIYLSKIGQHYDAVLQAD